jgi:hypothetical protein
MKKKLLYTEYAALNIQSIAIFVALSIFGIPDRYSQTYAASHGQAAKECRSVSQQAPGIF